MNLEDAGGDGGNVGLESRINKLDSVSFDALFGSRDYLGDANPVFDLSGIELVTPAAMVQLVAACYAAAKIGRYPTVFIPDDSVRGYLARAGFEAAVQNVAVIAPQVLGSMYRRRRGLNHMLIEITKIRDGRELPEVLDRIVDVLVETLKYEKTDAFDAATAVSEVSQNTFDHNRDGQTCGFLAMQVYGAGAGRFLEIGIADCGEGLAATLSRNPKNGIISSDVDAILQAVKSGTSEYDDPTRGSGLYHLLEIAHRHGGCVQIRTGEGKVRYRGDKKTGWSFNVSRLPGVQMALILGSGVASRN